MNVNMNNIWVSLFLFIIFSYSALSLPTIPIHPDNSKKHTLLVFGDSLSSILPNTLPDGTLWPIIPPSYEYRFSDGPVWVEDLADKLDFNLIDYARGGSTLNNSIVKGYTGPNTDVFMNLDVASQIEQIDENTLNLNQHDVVVIWGGANVSNLYFTNISIYMVLYIAGKKKEK